jgi:hypothetical protein
MTVEVSSIRDHPVEPALSPLPTPATGSANPASSLPALCQFVTPALKHIMTSPTNNANKAPAISADYYGKSDLMNLMSKDSNLV